MVLLHGEWNLSDLDYQLKPENLDFRYNQSQPKKLDAPQRVSPFKQTLTPTKINNPKSRYNPATENSKEADGSDLKDSSPGLGATKLGSNLQSAQIEYLKRIVCSLDSKLEQTSEFEKMNQTLMQNELRTNKMIEDLKKSLLDSSQTLKAENGKLRSLIESALLEKRKAETEKFTVIEQNE